MASSKPGSVWRAIKRLEGIFREHRYPQILRARADPRTDLRIPLLFTLRRDPYERATITSNTYCDWYLDRAFVLLPAAEFVGSFLATFEEYPPRQKPGSFTIGDAASRITLI
jgi:arylsulfatase